MASFIRAEVASQPHCWRQAPDVAERFAHALPRDGERVAVVGCGTSWFVAQAYARLRESAGLGETHSFAASEFPEGRQYDRLLAISRSGTTTEVLRLLAGQQGRLPTVAISADLATPIIDAVDVVVPLEFVNERSVVQTVSATTALAVLRAHLGQDIATLADQAERVVASDLDPAWLSAEQVTFLGRGWAYGMACEAALKMREACQAWTEAYPSMEYRHGPISIAAPSRLVWHFGPAAAGLADDVAATGATFIDNDDDPMVDLIRVQRIAAAVAERKGLDADHPRHLTRSVVLSS